MNILDQNTLPLYGCLTGFQLPTDEYVLARGVTLRSGIYEVFSSPVMAFSEAPPDSHTPGPWVSVHGGFSHKSRVELSLENLSAFDGLSPSRSAWLITALMRLQIEAPIRLVAVANIPLAALPKHTKNSAKAVETHPYQFGIFRNYNERLTIEKMEAVKEILPLAVSLMSNETFDRAFSIFDESMWSGRIETASTLIWTAIEILLGISGERNKTRAISASLSDCIAIDKPDRDRAYNVIKDLYEKRGRVVHSGRTIEDGDFLQLVSIARVAFVNTIFRGEVPPHKTPVP